MSNRRLVNHCLLGSLLAGPALLFGIYSLGVAQEPESAAFPSEASLRPVLRVAQAEAKPAAGNPHHLLDFPGGVALVGNGERQRPSRIREAWEAAIRCHCRANLSVSQDLEGFARSWQWPTDDNWALLNEAATWANADKHHGSYVALFNERSKQMAKVLGIVDKDGKFADPSRCPLHRLPFGHSAPRTRNG